MYRLRTSLGYEVVGTPEHRIALGGLWTGQSRLLRELETGIYVQLNIPETASQECVLKWTDFPLVHCTLPVTADVGLFLGYFMGDGSYGSDTLSIVCTREDHDIIEEVSQLVMRLFDLRPQTRIVGSQQGGVEVRVGCKALKPLFNHLGILRRQNGERPGSKRRVCVPDVIWRSPLPVIRAFLQGLFEADGFNGYNSPRIVLFSQYMDFLRDVQLLLLACGVTSQRKTSRRTNGQGYDYAANELILTGWRAVDFNAHVGFRSRRKGTRDAGYYRGRVKGRRRTTANRLEDWTETVIPAGSATDVSHFLPFLPFLPFLMT